MSAIPQTSHRSPRKVTAWDWPTRAFHWTLVTLIICAWASFEFAPKIGDPTLKWHRWNGYAILILVTFRLIWGVIGSPTSRFSSFVTWPWRALQYGLASLRGQSPSYLGHNPLGGWMIVVLLAAVATQGVLGLYTLEHNEIVAGPLKRTISDEWVEILSKWHVRGINIILGLVVIHVLANLTYQLVKKDPLITGMITGRKPAADYVDMPDNAVPANVTLRAVASLVAAAVIVFGTITLMGGRIL